jgi:trehalose-phosphatase
MARELEESDTDPWRRIDAAQALFCALDYDGTLAPIAPTPDAAVPYPGTATLLHGLGAAARIRVAIVSGRAIADVRRFLDLDGAFYIGIHGLEVRRPGGPVTDSTAGRRARAILPQLVARLRSEVGDRPGLLIEEKGAAVALHYRLAAAVDAQHGRDVITRLAEGLRAAGEPLDLLSGHEVVEVRPAGVDKGRTLCELLASDAPEALPLYIGDDRTDEDAFRALPPEAVTIRVGPAETETAAQYRLADPAAVHRFLEMLLRRV